MAELWEAFKVLRGVSELSPLVVLVIAAIMFRDFRRFMQATKNGIVRNCVHHRLIFDKLGVDHTDVLEAEVAAGLPAGKEMDLR